MAVDSGKNIMITADDRGVITFVDLATLKVTKQIQSFDKPSAMAVDTGLSIAIIVHGTWGVQGDAQKKEGHDGETRDNVTIVDLQGLSIRATMQAEQESPVCRRRIPSRTRQPSRMKKSDDITVVDLNSLMKKESLSVEKHPLSLSYNECLNSLSIIGGEDKGWMWGIGMDTLEKETAQAIPDKPEGIAIHSPFNRAFMTGRDGFSLIDLPNPVPGMLHPGRLSMSRRSVRRRQHS
ncbi:MAG: hypothetical protein MZV70_59660 [Desulfobacterales bacterium]|nr:hypothetical protein [Desulfobacterales bacterium]